MIKNFTENNFSGDIMLRNSKGFSIFTVISIIAFLALIFILILPQLFNVKEREMQEQRLEHMRKITKAIEEYMADRHQSFTGDLIELVRTGYLKHAYESPFNGLGDKYIASGNFDTGEVIVKDPNEDEFPIPKKL